jgi:hypothetical protein
VREIILSGNPIGRITEEFDRSLKIAFSDPSFKSELVQSLLLDSQSPRIPVKIRNQVCESIQQHLPLLSTKEFLQVPVFLTHLPSLQLATEHEDELFESWMIELSTNRLNMLNPEELTNLVKSLVKLRLVHPCKLQPIVRVFQSIAGEGVFGFLEAGARVLPREQLARSEIRAACIRLAKNACDVPMGSLVDLVSRLCIGPEAEDILRDLAWNADLPSPERVKAVTGGLFLNLPESVQWLENLTDDEKLAVYERLAERDCGPRPDFPSIPTPTLPWTQKGFAGLLIVSGSAPENVPSLIDPTDQSGIRVILSHMIRLGMKEELETLVNSVDVEMIKPKHVKKILKYWKDSSDEVREIVRKTLFKRLPSHLLIMAHVLVHDPSPELAAELKRVLDALTIGGSSLDILYSVEKTISMNGVLYCDPAVDSSIDSALRHVRKLVFRHVRMAPIE